MAPKSTREPEKTFLFFLSFAKFKHARHGRVLLEAEAKLLA